MLCPHCGKIIVPGQGTTELEGYECELPDKFQIHDLPCAAEIRKKLTKYKTAKAKEKFLIALFKKWSE